MHKIRCIVIDDEPFARQGIQGYVEKTAFLELVGASEDAFQLSGLLGKTSADLLFLDIEMPGRSGIDFLKSMANPPKVIFTTAFENYALQGFELDVLDYLLKPISFERFLKAANKALDYFSRNNGSTYLFVKVNSRMEKVTIDDILFIEALDNYIGIHTKEKKLITLSTLKNIQQLLPAAHFIQPHKSFLVNIDHIGALEGNQLYIGKHAIPISKNVKDDVVNRIVNKHLLKRNQDLM